MASFAAHYTKGGTQWLKQQVHLVAVARARPAVHPAAAAAGRVHKLKSLERAGLLAHAHTAAFRRKEQKALEWLRDVLERYNVFVNWSGGKDSTVCVHLANQVKPTPVVFMDGDGDHPLSHSYMAATAQKLGIDYHRLTPNLTYPELLELAYEFEENSVYLPPNFVREFLFYQTSEYATEILGCDAQILGLRANESAVRRMTVAVHGTEHASKTVNLTRLLAIEKWTTLDVLAYLVKHNVPLHPAYTDERIQGETLENIRVGIMIDPCSDHFGRSTSQLRHLHPRVYEKYAKRLPSLYR